MRTAEAGTSPPPTSKAQVKTTAVKTREAWWTAWGEPFLDLIRGDLKYRVGQWIFAKQPQDINEGDVRQLRRFDAVDLGEIMNHSGLMAKFASTGWESLAHRLPTQALCALTPENLKIIAPKLSDKQLNKLIGSSRCDDQWMKAIKDAVVKPNQRPDTLTEQVLKRTVNDDGGALIGLALNEANPIDLCFCPVDSRVVAGARSVVVWDVLRVLAYKFGREPALLEQWIRTLESPKQLEETCRVLTPEQVRSHVMPVLEGDKRAWFLDFLKNEDFRLAIEPKSRKNMAAGKPFVQVMLEVQQMHPLVQKALQVVGAFNSFVPGYRVYPTSAQANPLRKEEALKFLENDLHDWPEKLETLTAGARTYLFSDFQCIKSILEKNPDFLRHMAVNDAMWDLLLSNATAAQIKQLAKACDQEVVSQLKKHDLRLLRQGALSDRQLHGLHLLAAAQDDQLRASLMLHLDKLYVGHFHVIAPLLPAVDRLKLLDELQRRKVKGVEHQRKWLGMVPEKILDDGLVALKEEARRVLPTVIGPECNEAFRDLEISLDELTHLTHADLDAVRKAVHQRRQELDLQQILDGRPEWWQCEMKWSKGLAVATPEQMRQLAAKVSKSDLGTAKTQIDAALEMQADHADRDFFFVVAKGDTAIHQRMIGKRKLLNPVQLRVLGVFLSPSDRHLLKKPADAQNQPKAGGFRSPLLKS